jgi:hypothetical protein
LLLLGLIALAMGPERKKEASDDERTRVGLSIQLRHTIRMWSQRANGLASPSPMDEKDRFSNPLVSTGYFKFVLGRRVADVETTALDDLRAEVRVRVEDDLVWNSVEPAWGGLGFGVIQDSLYWWSARRLVLLPGHSAEDVRSLQVDEDIHDAFPHGSAWLLVCETSVRLPRFDGELSRINFPDVVTGVRWSASA